jgi:hypothetical protein
MISPRNKVINDRQTSNTNWCRWIPTFQYGVHSDYPANVNMYIKAGLKHVKVRGISEYWNCWRKLVMTGTSFYHKDTIMYHKDTTRIPQGIFVSFYHKDTTMYHKDTTRNLCVFLPQGYPRETKRNYAVSQGYPMTFQGTIRTSWSTLPFLHKVPQGIHRVLCHVYIRYHKESLEYSAMSI